MGLWSECATLYPLRWRGKGLGPWGPLPLLEGFGKTLQTQVVVPLLGESLVLLVQLNQMHVVVTDDVPAPLLGAHIVVAVVEGVAGAHSKHLRNLYIYFWRWATWKVFDIGDGKKAGPHEGIVCFITVAGFLNGPGFQQMRAYLRETCDDIWVIDCSPEGHQPEVNTRIFQGVQQPICIVMASRSGKKTTALGTVHFQALPKQKRQQKFTALNEIRLASKAWTDCPVEARAPFLPASTGAWSDFPNLEDLFLWNGSGVMPGRTWVIAPDVLSLQKRWEKLTSAPSTLKEALFQPHMKNGALGDKHSSKIVSKPLSGFPPQSRSVAAETGKVLSPVRYGYRSFDRQWIIPDSRIINQANPELWEVRSNQQVYMTALSRTSPSIGPAITFTANIPDLDHYNGRGGRTYPLWTNALSAESNVKAVVLAQLAEKYGFLVSAEDVLAYIAAITSNSAYTRRFRKDLSTPGLRIPFTSEAKLFQQARDVGRMLIWLHTFGERMVDPDYDRPAQPPRLPVERRPAIPKAGAISQVPEDMPDTLGYDAGKHRLLVGHGFIDNVTPAMWAYKVSGKQVLTQWFSYRRRNRERPIIGDRRKPSALGDIQPDHWLPEYTTELLNVLNVLGLLIDLEPQQAELLEQVCSGSLISAKDLKEAESDEPKAKPKSINKFKQSGTVPLFS